MHSHYFYHLKLFQVNTELVVPPTRVLQLNLNNPEIEQDKFVFK